LKSKSTVESEFRPFDSWEPDASSRKALLLRVGMDRGTGGALGPIFRDGTFEYIPIPEAVPTRCSLTYATLPGRHVPSLAAVLPARLAERHPHIDPDFRTATYGDAAPRKRRQLLRLAPGDMLLFYTGLAPRPPEDRPRLFATGSLHVRHIYHLRSRDIGRHDLQQKFGQTAHFLRRVRDEELALVEGEPGESELFARAIPLGDADDCLLRDLAPLGYQGSLLRSVGHWIKGSRSLRSLETWLHHRAASLVDQDTRLIPIADSALRASREDGDLAIEDQYAREGDWIIALSERGAAEVRAFGRINRIAPRQEGDRALSSLFWFFPDRGLALSGPTFPPLTLYQTVVDTAAIRQLVSHFDRHYRIGLPSHGRRRARRCALPCDGRTDHSTGQEGFRSAFPQKSEAGVVFVRRRATEGVGAPREPSLHLHTNRRDVAGRAFASDCRVAGAWLKKGLAEPLSRHCFAAFVPAARRRTDGARGFLVRSVRCRR
jgi:Nucleotide modification associated domain 3